MLDFKKVLCPTDFSKHSIRALHAAVEVSGKFGSELMVLNVVEPVPLPQALMTGQPGAPLVPRFNIDKYEEELVAAHGKLLAEIVEHEVPDDVECTQDVVLERDGKGIVSYAEEHEAGLIVISTHGRTGLSRLLSGSVAEHVIRHAPCPVLTVRAREEDDD